MVNHGIPSKACGPCRQKRRRCDRALPSCSQCIRAGVKCHGYRDRGLQIQFRDQTQKYGSKPAKPATSLEGPSASQADTVAAARHSVDSLGTLDTAAPTAPLFVLEDFSRTIFFKHFCSWGPNTGLSAAILRHYPTTDSLAYKMLWDISGALGIVIHPGLRQDSELVALARSKYCRALGSTQLALLSPNAVTADETTMTVLLLAFFELFNSSSLDAWKSWELHMEGASNLILLRGPQQLQTKTGREMFVHIRTRLVQVCYRKGVSLPPKIRELSTLCAMYQTEEERPGNAQAVIAERMCLLQEQIRKNNLATPEVLAAYQEIDKQLDTWFAELPDYFAPIDEELVPGSSFYRGLSWRYLSTEISSTLNYYRLLHVTVKQKLIRCWRTLSELVDTQHEIENCQQAILKLGEALCATIPGLLGLYGSSTPEPNIVNIYVASATPWIVLPVLLEPSIPSDMKQWLSNLLLCLSRSVGLGHAEVMKDALHGKEIDKLKKLSW